MHDDFSDWYRPCTAGTELDLTGDLLAKRWAGVEKLASAPGHQVKEIVRLALGRSSDTTSFMATFRAPFKEADATFQMSGNDLEVGVLAGSALCWIFNQEADEADEASLAVLCATSLVDAPSWSAPFISHARAYLETRLRELRKIPTVAQPQFSSKKLKQQCEDFAVKLAESPSPATTEVAKQMCETLVQTVSTLAMSTTKAIDQLDRQSELRRQETDVLWWLTAGVSRDLNKPFKDLKVPTASLVAGKELADLVKPPGILPSESLLRAIIPPGAGKAKKRFAVVEAINSLPREWRQSLIEGLESAPAVDLLPLLSAIKYSLTTDEADSWAPAYKKASRVDPTRLLEPVEMAQAIHRESLLVSLSAEE